MASDARDWLDAVGAAWRAERMAVRAKFALERSGRVLSERVALGIALANLRIVEEQGAPGSRVRVKVAVPAATDLDNLRITPGDPVRLWAEHPDEPSAVRGVVERRQEQARWLMLGRAVDQADRLCPRSRGARGHVRSRRRRALPRTRRGRDLGPRAGA
ncbi:MAG: hypothetical protein WKG01_28870 [Kofleriaceae bacterium]